MKKYDCYHGTGLSNYESIVNSKSFTFKPRNNHWLGGGVYFFVDDLSKARWWSKNNRPDKDTIPVILAITMEFQDEEVLNLDLEDDLKKLDSFSDDILESLGTNKAKLVDIPDEHVWQCKILEVFLKRNDKYSVVCRTFETTQKKGASLFSGLSKQMCVRDMSKIPIDKINLING